MIFAVFQSSENLSDCHDFSKIMRTDSLKKEAGHLVCGRNEIWLYEVGEIQCMDKNEGLDVMLFEFSPVLLLHAGMPSAAVWYIVE